MVASHRRNYTSLCAAQNDVKMSRFEKTIDQKIDSKVEDGIKIDRFIELDRSKSDRLDAPESSTEVDNKIDVDTDSFSMYEGSFQNVFRRKKIGEFFFVIVIIL